MSELRLNTDGHIIKLGADNDVSLTHVHDTGLLLNSTNVIQFNDASQNIGAPSATVLDINATDEIELNSTLIDINGNVEVSGTLTQVGVATFTAALLPASDDAVDLGSASKQWRDIYTGDLNLNNTKHRKNEVDGTSGSWTIQEGSEDLFLLNRINGKKYKFNIVEVK
jgi:hypothetical protein|tara:strand:+ start:1705 stop:2208 length:504 start_codon:yes stop_codon:yes gene_type:complete